ncbi:MAG: peptidoglycan bridge formation glycyltransferase FemA/FemB family protein [bacterium]|nr:peptidoglycan bridge formation glycyltransferase FemA/FemB family protein [bacterium]
MCIDENNWNVPSSADFGREFMQSWVWGNFQKSVGGKPIRLRLVENDRFIAHIQGFEFTILKLFKFIYFPKISLNYFSNQDKAVFFNYLEKQGYMFTRVESIDEIADIVGYKIVIVNNRQPKNTFILNLLSTEESILESMHSKTRYNIGLAERKGVEVKIEKNIDVFWNLNEETATRDKFKSHGKEYYKKMLELDICYQATAYLNDVPLASNICINYGGVFTYLHGASSNESRNLMAPYLLQWECIKLAKSLGDKKYDFGGVSPVRGQGSVVRGRETCSNNFCWDVTHKWTGITKFKVGFGGAPKNYPDAVEIVFKKNFYKLFNTIKKIFQ